MLTLQKSRSPHRSVLALPRVLFRPQKAIPSRQGPAIPATGRQDRTYRGVPAISCLICLLLPTSTNYSTRALVPEDQYHVAPPREYQTGTQNLVSSSLKYFIHKQTTNAEANLL